MHFPTQLDEGIEFSVAVVPITESACILPKHYNSSPRPSVVYEIESNVTTLPAPVRVRIQHCAITEEEDSLVFMVAHNGRPYRFQPLQGGKFPPGELYGEIEVREFCWITIFYNILNLSHMRMSLAVYETYDVSNNTMHFLVTKNLPANCSQVNQECNYRNLPKTMAYSITTTTISLTNLPIEEENGWHVKSHHKKASISMSDVHAYEPGCVIPNIELMMEWKGAGEPQRKQFEIKVEGGDMESFTLFCGYQPPTPGPPPAYQPFPPLQLDPNSSFDIN